MNSDEAGTRPARAGGAGDQHHPRYRSSGTAETGRRAPAKRHVAAVIAGNALEFYDFLTFTFFALYIGEAFFPSSDPTTSLLASLAVFGAGFGTRPVGGLVIGAIGDRAGRKPAMVLTFTLMGIAIVGVALTPSYAAIGVAAPIIVVGLRLVQGFALGGEVGPTTAFLIEAPPPERRGFYGSLQSASQYGAVLVAGIVATVLSVTLDHAALASWGWRVAFLVGAAVVPFGILVRRSLPETMEHAGVTRTKGLIRRHAGDAALGLALLAYATIATYTILFLTTYAITTLGITPRYAYGSDLVIGVCGIAFVPLGGMVADRVGRKPVMLWSTLLLGIITLPAFTVLDHFRSGAVLWAVTAVLSSVFGFSVGMTIVTTTELMPPSIRSGATATIYAVAIAVFGGTAQFNVAWLTDRTGNPLMPAYYMLAALVVGLVAILRVRETAPLAHRR